MTSPPITSAPATTFFIDRCLGSKKIVAALRQAGMTVEIHDDHFPPDAADVDWLPQVGEWGWVVLTKDANIARRTLEKIAGVAESGYETISESLEASSKIRRNHSAIQQRQIAVARANIQLFILTAQQLASTDMIAILIKAIVPMQNFVHKHPAPFIAKIHRNSRLEMWRDREALLKEFNDRKS